LIAAKTRSIANKSAYEIRVARIIFLDILILSSSPKLNFLINRPMAKETAAAGVASFIHHFSISLKEEFNLFTILGAKAKIELNWEKIKKQKTMIIEIFKNFLNILPPELFYKIR
jgi:hypothetical protein